MRNFLLFAWLMIWAVSAIGQENQLEKLRSQKDAAIARAVKPIDERYVKELEELMKVLTAAGDLEQALVVKKAIEDLGDEDSTFAETAESERLALLAGQRKDAVERVRAPIQATYVAELQKMLRVATSSGNLEEAVEIKNELADTGELHEPLGMEPGEGEFSVEALIGTEWELDQGGEETMFRFGEGKFQVHKRNASGEWVPGDYRSWKMENPKRRQIRIFWHYGEEIATFNSKMTLMKDAKHVLRRIEE